MAVTTTTELHQLVTSVGNECTSTILTSPNINLQTSFSTPVPEIPKQDPQTPRSASKSKDDIRYYFRPLPREDIRVYFRPVSKVLVAHPRVSTAKIVSSAEKAKARTPKLSPAQFFPFSPPPTPEVPPKAKARTSGQKNREILLAKQQMKEAAPLGQINQNGSAVLPGFDPAWTNSQTIFSSDPLSPRITEVVDTSLLPPPLRKRFEAAAISAPECNDRADKCKDQSAPNPQPTAEYQQSIVQEYQQTTLRQKPNSIYGTLPPLPIRLQRPKSMVVPESPRVVRHRRQDTPYSPDDVGKLSALNNPEIPHRSPSASGSIGGTSAYALSEVLPIPISLEEWASERRRIAHGQPATAKSVKSVDMDNGIGKEKTLKKTKSIDKRIFRSKKGKHDKKERVADKINQRNLHPTPKSNSIAPQASRSASQDPYHPGTRWDIGSLPPSPQLVRHATALSNSEVKDSTRSASVSDKIVVEPRLARVQSDQSTVTITAAKLKKPNKFFRVLEAYSKNVEGLQMVQ